MRGLFIGHSKRADFFPESISVLLMGSGEAWEIPSWLVDGSLRVRSSFHEPQNARCVI